MAYQKSKHVESAQKYLHQGKIVQAVAEYQIVLKHEPKDQVTLMTVGDLFVRQGETFQALEYFERLAQIYLSDGFLTKAIAIYKKITKLAPEEMRPVERLADLYVQQGVMSEARPIYLQMADMHQRANRPAQAVGLLRKLLDAEPDNIRVQLRLADLLAASGQPAEAANVLRTAAQQLLRRGDHAEALQFADRALKIDPADAATQALRARALVGAGKQSDAVSMLENLPDVDSGGETSTLLVDLYLDAGETPRAGELAERIFAREPQRYAVVQQVAAALLEKNEADRALVLLQLIHSVVLEGGDHEHYSDLLARVVELLPGRLEPLESLVALYKHTSDSFRLPDTMIHLAEAYETAGKLEEALQTYADFMEREPENEAVRRKQERLQARRGLAGSGGAAAVAFEAAAPPLPEQAPPSAVPPAQPMPELNLDEETELFIGQAITDVDLYSSYGLAQKAVELLEIVLQRAPDHAGALERLLDLSLGSNDDVRAVALATRLEELYSQCGNKPAAERFSDLRRRFERTAAAPQPDRATAPSAAAPPPVAPAPVPSSISQTVAPREAPVASGAPTGSTALEFEIPVVDAQPLSDESADGEMVSDSVVHEVDLSEEWAALATPSSETAPAAAESVEDYESILNERQASDVSAGPLDPEPVTEQPIPEVAAEPLPLDSLLSETKDDAVAAADPAVQELLDEYELALNSGATAATPPNGSPEAPETIDSFMRSISSELDALLPAPVPAPPAPAASRLTDVTPTFLTPPSKVPDKIPETVPENRGPLGELFDEFRADMGESGEKEDWETHYNLGVAYREMGLMEEAISEFQKVASAHQQGQPFRYAMQCYTLLALAFVDRGQPSIAVSWYERALRVPGLDPETVLALRYDLGVSQEMSGDTEAAHKSFSQVYGMNIDYRDVAERLAALGRTR